MARRAVTQRAQEISHNFYIPEGLEDSFSYSENDGDDDDLDVPGGFGNEGVAIPDSLVVISQTLRTLKNGQEVVDVVFEVENIPGATKYELRVTKV